MRSLSQALRVKASTYKFVGRGYCSTHSILSSVSRMIWFSFSICVLNYLVSPHWMSLLILPDCPAMAMLCLCHTQKIIKDKSFRKKNKNEPSPLHCDLGDYLISSSRLETPWEQGLCLCIPELNTMPARNRCSVHTGWVGLNRYVHWFPPRSSRAQVEHCSCSLPDIPVLTNLEISIMLAL